MVIGRYGSSPRSAGDKLNFGKFGSRTVSWNTAKGPQAGQGAI
jgi:hypothetical protein